MQCNKVVCLWAEWECMWTYIRMGGGGGGGEGRQTGGESEEDLDRKHPDIYNCTGQQPNLSNPQR